MVAVAVVLITTVAAAAAVYMGLEFQCLHRTFLCISMNVFNELIKEVSLSHFRDEKTKT